MRALRCLDDNFIQQTTKFQKVPCRTYLPSTCLAFLRRTTTTAREYAATALTLTDDTRSSLGSTSRLSVYTCTEALPPARSCAHAGRHQPAERLSAQACRARARRSCILHNPVFSLAVSHVLNMLVCVRDSAVRCGVASVVQERRA